MNDRSFNIGSTAMTKSREVPARKRERAIGERRARIMEAAMACFLENGYHQTGVRDIARRAGVSLGNLYNHFPGKHDVLAEIASLERAELEPFLEILTREGPAASVLEEFINAYAHYLADPENVILTIEIASEAIRKPDIGALFLSNRGVLVAALARVVERGINRGDFRAGLDPDNAAQLVIELIDASAYRSVLGDVAMRHVLNGLLDFITAALRA